MEAAPSVNDFENTNQNLKQRVKTLETAARRLGSLDCRPTPASRQRASVLSTTFRTTPFARGAGIASVDAVPRDTTARDRTRIVPSAKDESRRSALTTASWEQRRQTPEASARLRPWGIRS